MELIEVEIIYEQPTDERLRDWIWLLNLLLSEDENNDK